MAILSDIFDIYNGIVSSELKISEEKTEDCSIPFLRPSSSWENLVVGYVNPTEISSKFIFPANSLFVSTNGEGSHSYSYVSPFSFIPNSDISVLIPKKVMSLNDKLFYAMCITQNRYKFSYGRKPKGLRLASINLPDATFNWAKKFKIDNYNHFDFSGNNSLHFKINDSVPITELFDISYGNKLNLNAMTITDKDATSVAFVSRTSRNLGIVEYVEPVTGVEPFPPGLITVALGGSILSTSLQPHAFYTAQNIVVLRPKKEMSIPEKLFFCMCIEHNKFKYTAFGREANITFKSLMIPKTIPSDIINFSIEKYYI